MTLSPSSSKRLLQYELGGGAVAAAGALPSTTQASIVHTPGQLTAGSIYFDLDPAAGSAATTSGSAFAAADFHIADQSYPTAGTGQKPVIMSYGNNGTNTIEDATRGTHGFAYALRLSAGTTIGGAATFNTSTTYFNNTSANGFVTGQGLGDWTPGTSG